ncbi:class I SAM-dependent methyltransferase [Neobacillus sp. LXY-1]|uniref:class I SAM-dependent methyltransferase n=1 Tax=Neobacillus sp. LXY-1 TaxID=3379133 RepID=UPI003EE1EB95
MDSKLKWNSKYKQKLEQLEKLEPNLQIKRVTNYLRGGTALDLACGLGGNSVFLARLNYQVQAIDISEEAIQFLQQKAENENLSIVPVVKDLTEWKDINQKYDLVVIMYYLDRLLFPRVKTIIKENGYFFMETYYQVPNHLNNGISDQYKLKSKELLEVFKDWNVILFEENELEGRQTIFCQKRSM